MVRPPVAHRFVAPRPSFPRPSPGVIHPVNHVANPAAQESAASCGGRREVGGATATVGLGVGVGMVQLSLAQLNQMLEDAKAGQKGEVRKVDVKSRPGER